MKKVKKFYDNKNSKFIQKVKYSEAKEVSQYVPVPAVVFDNPDLNATDKIILSWIHAFKKETKISTSKIATSLNLTRETINYSIKKLIMLELIEQEYYCGRKRSFTSLLDPTTNKDTKSLISSDVLINSELTSTFKLTLGVFIQAALGKNNYLGGYNFKNMSEIAEILKIHVSSVYRHLAHFQKLGLVEREYASYLVKAKDEFSNHHHEQQAIIKRNLDLTGMANGKLVVHKPDWLDEYLDEIKQIDGSLV